MKNSKYEIPTRRWPGSREYDLTGLQIGNLKVIGYYGGKSRANRGSAWVCRCVCGRHEVRRSQSLRRGVADVCQACQAEKKIVAE
jgi:predicted SprT family Zn-dependent metalloprotease